MSSAVGVCDFVDPIEARDVIATVLDMIEKQDRAEPALSAR